MPHDRCGLLRRVCVVKGDIVSFDPQYAYPGSGYGELAENASTLPPPLPYLPSWRGSWNIPGATNSDAIVGNQVDYSLRLRRASRAEARAALTARRTHPPSAASSAPAPGPAFSRCTLPVVLLSDWPFNFCEFFVNAASAADHLFRRQGMLPDRSATLVLSTPSGLGLMAFHRALLGHLSSRPLLTLDELAAAAEEAEDVEGRGGEGGGAARRVGWSAEGVPVSCFERMVVCKLEGSPQPPLITAGAVTQHLLTSEPGLPHDPLRFLAADAAAANSLEQHFGIGGGGSGGGEAEGTLRVVVEARSGGTRTIRNLHSLLAACGEPGWRGGPFTRLDCRALPAFDTPSLHGSARFRAAVAAVRSAHVYVAVHGAGAANALFLTPDGAAAGAARALLEIRPCGFGSGYPWWVDVHMAVQLPRSGDQVRFHAYNIEDPEQCSPADWAAAAAAAGGAANTRAGLGHMLRDQHVTLRPDGFRAMLAHVASMLRDPAAYDAARAAGRLHGYALPYRNGTAVAEAAAAAAPAGGGTGEGGAGVRAAWGPSGGVVLGPLAVGNLTAHLAGGALFLLPPG